MVNVFCYGGLVFFACVELITFQKEKCFSTMYYIHTQCPLVKNISLVGLGILQTVSVVHICVVHY